MRQAGQNVAVVAGEAGGTARRSRVRAAVATARPRQWAKNLIVFAAPVAAFVVGRPVTFWRTAAAVVVFCAASSGVYFVNDAVDAEADRRHPRKRLRPVARGELSRAGAVLIGAVLIALSVTAAGVLASPPLVGVVAGYAAISVAYSLALKRVPVLELFCISAGFVLRAVAGGVAAHIPISPWFLVVACAGSLLIASGKRTAELMVLGDGGAGHRASLGWYREEFLAAVRLVSSGVTVLAYFGWAVERWASMPARGVRGPFMLATVVPFALAVLVLSRALGEGRGGAPEDLALHDRLLQGLGAAWLLLMLVTFAA